MGGRMGRSMGMGRGQRGRMRRAAAGARLLAGGLALGAAGAAYYVASSVTRPGRATPRDDYTFTPFELGVPYEEVTFPPEDGDHVVRGWWLPRPETRRVVIVSTGYRAKRSDMLGISSAMWRAGHNVLVYDFHGHGAGIGAPVTLAYRELNDFLGALDYTLRRVRGARVGLVGFSMGAAVSIMGAARRPEVRAVVADSSFATHAEEVEYSIRQTWPAPVPLARALARLTDHFLYWRAGYRHRDVEPLREIPLLAPRPILLIHSSTDETINVEDAYRLYEAAGEPKELWIGDATSHCGVYFIDRAAYCRRVADFFARTLDATDAWVLPRERAVVAAGEREE